mgnify:CR=1 FL=1
MRTQVTIAGVQFKNPVLTASGTFGSGMEYAAFTDLNKLGGVVTKGVSGIPWEGNPTPRVTEVYGGMLNAIGLQNPGIDVFIERDLAFLKGCDTNVIVNVCGKTVEEYVGVVERLSDEAGVSMLEINVSCPNVKEGAIAFGQNADALRRITAEVKRHARKPVIMKLSPNVTDIAEMAKAAESAGADAISLINTLTGMKIDVRTRRFVLANRTGGLSGPAIKPVAVRMVYQAAQAVKIPVIGMGGRTNGVPREDHFCISVASEIMAIICLSRTISELKERIDRIVIGQTYARKEVRFAALKCTGAVAALLKDAVRPNLVQTLEKTPAFIHGGPFANIAHGCNSVIATKLALKLGDYTVTEAGFGADLGAEKFFDIKCRMADLHPSAVVLVATVRALKYHGGVEKENLTEENIAALIAGFPNLLRHADNIRKVFGLPCVVAINRFPSDTDAELKLLHELCASHELDTVISEVWAKGGEGGLQLAERVIELCEQPNRFRFCYAADTTPEEKLNAIARQIYHADGVVFTDGALSELREIKALGFGNLPVCVAKTQYSFSDDPKKRGVPSGFRITVRKLRVAAGAGFIVALTGSIMTMPGLSKHPAAEAIDVDENGNIVGLF